MDGYKPGSRDYPEGFPREPPLVPRGARDVSWPLPPAFPHPGDRQAFMPPPAGRYGAYMGRSPDGNALAAAQAYFQMRNSASPAGLPAYMPGMDRHRTAMAPPQWADYRHGGSPYPEAWPYGKALAGFDPLRPPFDGKGPAPGGFAKESEDDQDGSDATAWKANRGRAFEMRPPATRESAERPSSPWQSRPSTERSTPGRWMPSSSKPAAMPDNCLICREPRPEKIEEGGTRCTTTKPVRDKDGAVLYDKDGTAKTTQCPHVFMPTRAQRNQDGDAGPSVSGQKQPLRDSSDFHHRLPKLARTDDGFFRPPPQFLPGRRVDAGAAGPTRKDSGSAARKAPILPTSAPAAFGLATASATILRPVTVCPKCKFEHTEPMEGTACTNLVPSKNAKGEAVYGKNGAVVQHPCGHQFTGPEDCVLLKKIEMLSPELRGMLIKGKPRKLQQIENDFWKAVGKIEKELPKLGGGDVFISMISFVAATETKNSESLRFASCKLSDGTPMTLVLLRYCTGKYSKIIYGRPEFDDEIDKRLDATLQQLAAAQEHAMQAKKKSKQTKTSNKKCLKAFLQSIGLSDCLPSLQTKEFDLETLIMGSSSDGGGPGLMTPEFLAEETGIAIDAAGKIMDRASKMRRKQRAAAAKGSRKRKA